MNEFEKEYVIGAIEMIRSTNNITSAISTRLAHLANEQIELCEVQEYLRTIHYAAVTIQKICRPFMTEKVCMDGQSFDSSQPDKSVGAETER